MVVFNLSELHKATTVTPLASCIPMISQRVNYADEGTVANCHLCNYPLQNLYEIKESGDEEKALFAAMTRKHQIETDCVVGGIGTAAAVTMLWDAILSTSVHVCLACTVPVLGAHYQGGGPGNRADNNIHWC